MELDERILTFSLSGIEADFPEEFKGRINIGKLAAALDEQLNIVLAVLKDLHKYRTYEGGYPDAEDYDSSFSDRQLDLAGDNVVISRAEAGVISSPNMDKTLTDIMNNGDYRRYIKYKAYKNSSECTYYDLITMLSTISDGTIEYREDPAHPATIYVKPENWDIDFPPVAPAGVGFIVERERKDNMNLNAGVGSVLKRTYHCEFSAKT